MQSTRAARILSMALSKDKYNEPAPIGTDQVPETVINEFNKVYEVDTTDGTLRLVKGDSQDTTNYGVNEIDCFSQSNIEQQEFQNETIQNCFKSNNFLQEINYSSKILSPAHEHLEETVTNFNCSSIAVQQDALQCKTWNRNLNLEKSDDNPYSIFKKNTVTKPASLKGYYLQQTCLLETSNNMHITSSSFDKEKDKSLSHTKKSDDPDYIPEQDHEFSSEIANNVDASESIGSSDEDTVKRRQRKRKPDKENWNRLTTKSRRMHGVDYAGFQRNKDNKISYGIRRPSRKIGDRCTSLTCIKSTKHFCASFSEEERNLIFRTFWETMDWKEKKAYIIGNIVYTKTLRSSKGEEPSRRNGTYWYYLRNKNNEKKRVCKRMFLNTFDIKEDMVHDWFKKTEHGLNTTTETTNQNSDQRRPINQNKIKRNFLIEWFNSLPKMPSHYCRKDTKKQYFETVFQSKVQLYKEYLKHCDISGQEKLSYAIFDQIFCDLNLSLYQPKKDCCDTCSAFEVKNIDQDVYALHIERKNLAREEKGKDKEDAINFKNYTFTMDLQAVKNSPVLNASAIYYKKKLTVHNFTMYNLENHEASNYWWDETEGNLSASTFASLITHHIEENCVDRKLPVILWSDGCCYQNRNCTLSNALLNLSIKLGQVILQKYLEKGHTQMECDSVHHLIEMKLKNRKIFLPHDYIRATEEARLKPAPFKARLLTHDFFKNYLFGEAAYKSIRPGKMKNDPTVTDIRVLMYDPEKKQILFKTNFNHSFKPLPVRAVNSKGLEIVSYPNLHKQRLCIKSDKYC